MPANSVAPSQWFRRKALKHPSRVRPRIRKKCHTAWALATIWASAQGQPRWASTSKLPQPSK